VFVVEHRVGAIMRLNHRQLAFARAIAQGLSGAQAQIRAGYRPNRKNKNELLSDPRVIAEVNRLRALVDAEWARTQANPRLLDDPRVVALLRTWMSEFEERWSARQRKLDESR
jgi:hypothetical protein